MPSVSTCIEIVNYTECHFQAHKQSMLKELQEKFKGMTGAKRKPERDELTRDFKTIANCMDPASLFPAYRQALHKLKQTGTFAPDYSFQTHTLPKLSGFTEVAVCQEKDY